MEPRKGTPGFDILERTFRFSVAVTKSCRRMEADGVSRSLSRQLLRSATSIGASAEESQAGQSRADFMSKNAICLKEARETRNWLRLIRAAGASGDPELPILEQEALELMRIFGSIITSAKRSDPK